jgi:membrane protein DedA with SNARE-associated domain
MNGVLDFVRQYVVSSPTAYPLIGAFVALDALVPLIPAELILISSTLIALQGELTLALVFVAGFAGAVVGDAVIYSLGGRLGEPAAERLAGGHPGRRGLRRARRQWCRHGEGLLVASRFLPLGRTAATFAAGMLGFPWRRFLAADVLAAALSVGYLMAVGVVGGRAFAASFWPSLVVSLGIVALVLLSVELARRLLQMRRSVRRPVC